MKKAIRGCKKLQKYFETFPEKSNGLSGNSNSIFYYEEHGKWFMSYTEPFEEVSFEEYFKEDQKIDRNLIIDYRNATDEEILEVVNILENAGEKIYPSFKENPLEKGGKEVIIFDGYDWFRRTIYNPNTTAKEFINKYKLNTTTIMYTEPTKAKPMSITKTETVAIGKKNREITITILTDENNPFKVRAGYSVRDPKDRKSNPEMAKKISTGRAISDKTNMVDMYLGEGMQNKKYILYAIAEQLFRELSSGTRQIKGIR